MPVLMVFFLGRLCVCHCDEDAGHQHAENNAPTGHLLTLVSHGRKLVTA
jgi:hypothetical protein